MTAIDLLGIHHLKFAVSDLEHSLSFYEWLLNAERLPAADHRGVSDGRLYAYILKSRALGCMIELRLNSARAARNRGADPLTIAVADRAALSAFATELDRRGVVHSPIISALQGWLLVVESPDGLRVRFYTLETHGPEIIPDESNDWLSDTAGLGS